MARIRCVTSGCRDAYTTAGEVPYPIAIEPDGAGAQPVGHRFDVGAMASSEKSVTSRSDRPNPRGSYRTNVWPWADSVNAARSTGTCHSISRCDMGRHENRALPSPERVKGDVHAIPGRDVLDARLHGGAIVPLRAKWKGRRSDAPPPRGLKARATARRWRSRSYGRTPMSFATLMVLKRPSATYHFTRVRVASFVSRLPTVSTCRPPGDVRPATAPSPSWKA